METFKLNNGMEIVCEWAKTRNGFKHTATLINANGQEYSKCKICYLNRTWERFTYESVLNKMCNAEFGKSYEEMRLTK